MALAFMGDRLDEKVLQGDAFSGLAGEAQAKLLHDEKIGFVEVGPGERFAGPVRGRRAGGSLIGDSSSSGEAWSGAEEGCSIVSPHRVVTPCDSQFTTQPVNTLSLWRSSTLSGSLVGL